ncbi:TetR/AcrR family transcriptional regulator [Leadbettera azotonutricia]|uniref:Putative transcriptional regulator, TetR family n=1 Tax=Leadbettera azotonutricia (strain ATCC BAA-888 / DSM 13862 / ZAS-9) TaxID=545695 RepID=F5YBB0_LEAAZ|nr:TetR/AcrR family transcriptional regulator [Leadbettera azotonutricia]AEF82353.1 putative transcriptional regulator, TetR family [Leadbettera azotonutricia ZAS-9]
MSIVVEHDKRRREILEKALDAFMDDGFEDVTFQKIADRCGITRTTLYIYFKNKKDIFNFSIKQLLAGLEHDITEVGSDETLNSVDKLSLMLIKVIDKLEENRRLLTVIMNYLLYLAKGSHDPDYRVRRRTIRLRHILATILIEGIKKGEIAKVNIKDADNLLYGLVETAAFRLVILKQTAVDDLKRTVVMAVRQLAAVPGTASK